MLEQLVVRAYTKHLLLILGTIGIGVLMSCKNPLTGPQTSSGPPPPTFYMKQNFPNPFTDSTRIEYGVPSAGGIASLVTMIVYDRFRQEMRTLVYNGGHPSGTFFVTWDGMNKSGAAVSPGIYIVEFRGYTPQASIIQITTLKK